MVPDNSTGIPRAPAYSGAGPPEAAVRVPASHRLRGRVPSPSASPLLSFDRSYNPATGLNRGGLGYSPFARRYWGNRVYFLFLRVLRCFSSPRSPQLNADDGIAPAGLPHSDIRGSMCICHSPRLFAACHVLLRLREPRHPPCALVRSVMLLFLFPLEERRKYSPELLSSTCAFDLLVKLFVVFLLLSSHPASLRTPWLPALSLSFSESSPWQS